MQSSRATRTPALSARMSLFGAGAATRGVNSVMGATLSAPPQLQYRAQLPGVT